MFQIVFLQFLIFLAHSEPMGVCHLGDVGDAVASDRGVTCDKVTQEMIDDTYSIKLGPNAKFPKNSFDPFKNLYRLEFQNLSRFPKNLEGLKNVSVLSFSGAGQGNFEFEPPLCCDLSSVDELEFSNFSTLEFKSRSFVQLPNLKKLILYSIKSVQLEPQATDSLKSLRSLLIESELLKFPEEFKNVSSLEKIEIKQTKISHLNFENSALTKLDSLILMDNQLRRLPKNGFSSLSSLSLLFLWGEKQLETIEDGAFQGLGSLTSLLLNENSISKISKDTLLGLKKVTEIELQENGIEQIDPKSFAELTSLKKVSLGGNRLTELDGSWFAGLNQLEQLIFNVNRIATIVPNSFSNEKLKELSLGANLLTEIPNIFSTKTNILQDLDIDGNRIKSFQETNLGQFPRLKLVRLGTNPFLELPEEAFKNNDLLEHIYLRRAFLAKLSSRAFKGLGVLKSVSFDMAFIPENLANYFEFDSPEVYVSEIRATVTRSVPMQRVLARVLFDSSVSLSGCSGSFVKIEGMSDTQKALILTNGHCVGRGSTRGNYLAKGEILKGIVLENGEARAYSKNLHFDPQKLVYATMTGTDLALFEIPQTYEELNAIGVKHLIVSAKNDVHDGDVVGFASLAHHHVQVCEVQGVGLTIKEDQWDWNKVLGFGGTDCRVIGGDSGSPMVNDQGELVGLVNTANWGGEACSANAPCELMPDGSVKSVVEKGYAVDVTVLASCVENGAFDIESKNCGLAN